MSRSKHALALPLSILTLVAACGGGGGGSAAPPPIPAMVTAPTIELDLVGTYSDPVTGELKGDPAGTASVTFELEQGAGDSAGVVVEYSDDGGTTWTPADIVEDLSDLTAPATGSGGTAPPGTAVSTEYTVTWNLASDLGPGDFASDNEGVGFPAIELRVVVVGGDPSPPADDPVEVDLMGFPFPSDELMGTARSGHASAVLDGGDLLVVGGEAAGATAVAGAELGARVDHIADFVFSGAGTMGTARAGLAQVFLADGTLLLAGGSDAGGPRAEVEVYDPVAASFTSLASMHRARVGAAAFLLPNGLPVVIGGDAAGDSYEIHDPVTGLWTLGSLGQAYEDLLVVSLSDGRLLVTGAAPGTDTPRAEFLDLTGDLALSTGPAPTPTTVRRDGTATVLLSGEVLFFGGRLSTGAPASPTAEVFDPQAGTWTALPDDNAAVPGYLAQARWGHAADLTGTGRLLISGGRTSDLGGHLARTDYFLPEGEVFTPSSQLPEARAHHQVDRLEGGYLVVSGGLGPDGGGPEAPVGTTATLIPPDGTDALPTVTIQDLTYQPPLGQVVVDYTLTDAESHPARVRLEWTTRPQEPKSWRPMTLKFLIPGVPLGDGYHELETSPTGTAHNFAWNVVVDDIFAAGSPQVVHVRVTPIGAAEGATVEFSKSLP